LGAGAFTLSAVVYLFGLKRFQPIVRLAVFVGFVGYSAALLTLVMDIGRPDRFWHPWVYWNVHSVLWEITWCIHLPDDYLIVLAGICGYEIFQPLAHVTRSPTGCTVLRPCCCWVWASRSHQFVGRRMALWVP
jgi:Ni/Fe-hydrogenase subunit HybB-like protein